MERYNWKFVFSFSVGMYAGSLSAQCPTYTSATQVGQVQSTTLTEISGLAASRTNNGVYWAHNDSGDSARVRAVNTGGASINWFTITGASAVDWEDIAVGPGPVGGQNYMYFADTGNNALNRSVVTIYRIAEPVINPALFDQTIALSGAVALNVQYPSGNLDAESIMVDPVYGDIYLVTRDRNLAANATYIYKYPAPHNSAVTTTLTLVHTMTGVGEITAADISASGDLIAIRGNSGQGYLWERNLSAPAESVDAVFANSACSIPISSSEPQGETIAFSPDGLGYFTISEGAHQPIYYYGEDVAAVDVPAAPGGLAVIKTSTQMNLTWSLIWGSDSYVVYRSETAGGPYSVIGTPTATAFSDTSVVAGTRYYYVIAAVNSFGEGAISEERNEMIAAPPAAPSGLSGTALSRTSIRLNWTDNSSNETGFQVYRSTDNVSFTLVTTTAANAVTYTVTGLTRNKLYYFKIRSTNAAGNSAYTPTISLKTLN